MFLLSKTVKAHRYYYVVASRRRDNRPVPETLLYLGRLDGLSLREVTEKRTGVRALDDALLTMEFETLLVRLGYPPPLPSLREMDIARVRPYGPGLALFRVAEELSLIELIDRNGRKGGGPSLGKMTFALAAYADLHHGSMLRFVKWYERSTLPIFLEMPPAQVTYDAALNTLDYLQPDTTREMERELYSKITKRFGYGCEHIDIDSSPVELSGVLCRVIAKFGRSKKGGTGKRRQILITFMLDQKSVLLGHEVFPGNRNDTKTLKRVNGRLSKYDVPGAPRVVDRGYASLKNIGTWKRRKEHFLAALKSRPKGLKLLDELGPHTEWNVIGEGVTAASLIRDGLKWVVTWNDDVARRNGDGRRARVEKALNDLRTLSKSIENGRVKSRSERDRKIGAILRRHRVTRLISVKGERKGMGFTYTAKDANGGGDEGYQVYATTETSLSERDVVDAYRSRDRVEKAIRTMKSCLGLGPVWVTKKEHVLGFVYIHALAYQLRSVMALMLDEAKVGMSVDEALWELERLNAVEFVVGGDEIAVMRRLTAVDGTLKTLAQVFSFASEDGYPGISSGTRKESI